MLSLQEAEKRCGGKRRRYMKTEAEMREECLPVKKCQGHPQPPEGGREAWNTFFLLALKGANTADTLSLDFRPPEL